MLDIDAFHTSLAFIPYVEKLRRAFHSFECSSSSFALLRWESISGGLTWDFLRSYVASGALFLRDWGWERKKKDKEKERREVLGV